MIIKKKKNKNKYIIIAIIIFIMIATMYLITNLIIKKETSKTNNNQVKQNSNKQEQIEENDDAELEEIKSLSESNRMKRYIGNFFSNIEEGDYQKAYNILNAEFRSNYFSNIEDFKKYADKNFKNNMLGVTYDNIERWGNNKTGNMYVLWVTVADMKKGKQETNFVIIEKDYNNYEMSFSVSLEE